MVGGMICDVTYGQDEDDNDKDDLHRLACNSIQCSSLSSY